MRSFERGWMALVLVLAVASRVFVLSEVLYHPERAYTPDSARYEELAKNLLDRHEFAATPYFMTFSFAHEASPSSGLIYDTLRTPLYPAFMAGVFTLFGRSVPVVLAVQNVLSILTLLLVYRVGRLAYSPRAGLIAMTLLALDLGYLAHASFLLSEALLLLLFMGSLERLLTYVQAPRMSVLVQSALLLGLATLCKPIAMYFSVIVGLLLVLTHRQSPRLAFRSVVLFLVIVAAVVSPWFLRNQLLFHKATLSSVQGFDLYAKNASFLEAHRKGTYWEDEKAVRVAEMQKKIDAGQLNTLQAAALCQASAVHTLLEDPITYAQVHAYGMMRMFIGHNLQDVHRLVTETPYPSGQLVSLAKGLVSGSGVGPVVNALRAPNGALLLLVAGCVLFRGLELLLLCFSVLKAWRVAPAVTAFFVLTLLYFNALTGPYGISPWYRIPILPFIALLCGAGLWTQLHDASRPGMR